MFPDERLHVQGSIAYSSKLRHANSTAEGEDAVAIGPGNQASGVFATAMGSFTDASGPRSTTLGTGTRASGASSTAMGTLTEATNTAATAMGSHTEASGSYSTAMGQNTEASGSGSMSTGDSTKASGENAAALGVVTEAQAYGSLVIGRYNVVAGESTDWLPEDPVFVIGNGDQLTRSNALTVYKNGNATLAGSLFETSDSRLKRDIVPLDEALSQVSRLRGITFRWKDERLNEGQHFGLLAQEVEKIFPELVSTDSEGVKAVNYTGLVVPLLRAIQQQQDQIDQLKNRLSTERPDTATCQGTCELEDRDV